MLGYLIRRVVATVPVLALVALGVYALLSLSGGASGARLSDLFRVHILPATIGPVAVQMSFSLRDRHVAFEDNIMAEAWAPMDDTLVMRTYRMWNKRSPAMRKLGDGSAIPGLELTATPILPRTDGWYGRFRSQANASNDYLIDREAQQNRSFSGLTGIEVQDHAAVESMGEIVDRTKEHLASSGRMISLTRRTMLRTLRAHMVDRATPPGVDNPTAFRGARGGSLVAPEGGGWLDLYASKVEAAKHAQGPGVAQAAE